MKQRVQNFCAVLWNISVGWLLGVAEKEYESKSSLPINHAKLIDDLLFVCGNQILLDGCLNGDPHPGIFFYLE